MVIKIESFIDKFIQSVSIVLQMVVNCDLGNLKTVFKLFGCVEYPDSDVTVFVGDNEKNAVQAFSLSIDVPSETA